MTTVKANRTLLSKCTTRQLRCYAKEIGVGVGHTKADVINNILKSRNAQCTIALGDLNE